MIALKEGEKRASPGAEGWRSALGALPEFWGRVWCWASSVSASGLRVVVFGVWLIYTQHRAL